MLIAQQMRAVQLGLGVLNEYVYDNVYTNQKQYCVKKRLHSPRCLLSSSPGSAYAYELLGGAGPWEARPRRARSAPARMRLMLRPGRLEVAVGRFSAVFCGA